MTSVQITPGTQYYIYTPYHIPGYLHWPNSSSAFMFLGDPNRTAQRHVQWTFVSTEGSSNEYSIMNSEGNSWVSSEPRSRSSEPAPGDQILLSPSSIRKTWFLRPMDDTWHQICDDAACARQWAALARARAGGSSIDQEIVVVPSNQVTGAETWRIVPVTTAATPSSTSSTGTTSTITSLPIVTTTSTSGPSSSATSSPSAGNGGSSSNFNKDLQALQSCAPCGKAECSFIPESGTSSMETYSVLIGQPVANCNPNSKESTKTTLGGTFELARSFGVEATAGFTLGSIGPSVSMSTTVKSGTEEKVTRTQQIEVTIAPGQIGALVANITYTKTPGKMSIDDRTLAFLSITPDAVLGYSVVYTDCGSNFSALTLPKSDCRPDSGVHGSPEMMGSFLSWVLVMFSLLQYFVL